MLDKTLPLDVQNVKKSFGKKKVLDGITFSVKPKEIFGLIGLNGIGKTTLIKIILDLLDSDSGSVNIFGRSSLFKESRKNLAYLPEKFQPSSSLKGKEFLLLFSGDFDSKFGKSKVEKVASLLSLEIEALNRSVGEYSKGMIQKLGLMSAFLGDSKLVILDEPMSGLDPGARINLKDELLAYKKMGNSIFFSSHILSDIDEICDRIAIIDKGKIVFIGKPSDFKKETTQKTLERAFLKKIGL
jgi:ABC-2 type transport system ATP-binding protein